MIAPGGGIESLAIGAPGNRAFPHADKKSHFEGLLMALTGKKRLFSDAVKAGKSNKDAAIAAGYSVKTASQAGSRLVKDKDVVAYLAKGRSKPAEPHHGLTLPSGHKAPDAPPNWPFGTQPPTAPSAPKRQTAEEYLYGLVNDVAPDVMVRKDAAKALLAFEKAKPAQQGKKDAKNDAAKKVENKFAALASPKLVVSNQK